MSPDDKLLFDRWTLRRDAEAFNEMARRYAAMVFHTCARVLRNDTDAQDVAQDCFETLATLRKAPSTSLGAYLHAMAFNKSLNRIKSDRRRADRESRYVQNQPPKETDRWDDLYAHVDAAIATLPKQLREPVIGHFLEGKTHDEIARREGVSRPAVSQRIQRGVEQIRERLRKQGIAVGGSVLAALLAENAAGAAPAAVLGAIGKLSVAGAAATPVGGLSVPVVATVVTLVCAVLLGGGALVLSKPRVESPFTSDAPSSVAADAAGSEIAPQDGERAASFAAAQEAAVGATPDSGAELPANQAATAEDTEFAVVFGRVADYDGNPLGGLQVGLRGATGSGAWGSTVSAADGTFRFGQVVPAEEVRLHAEGNEPVVRSEQIVIQDVLAGQSYECDLVAYDLRADGRIVDRSGSASPIVEVMAFPSGVYDGGLPTDEIGEDGSFAIAGLVPGEWEWRVKREGEEWEPTGQMLSVAPGRPLSNLVVEVREPEGYTLAGWVQDPEGHAIANAYVRVHTKMPPYDSQTTHTDDAGYFVLEGLLPSRYFAYAAHEGFGTAYKQDTALPTSEEIVLVLPRRGGLIAHIVDKHSGAPVTSFDVFEATPLGGDVPTSVTYGWNHFESPEGQYVAEDLLPEPLKLRIRSTGYANYESTVEIPSGHVVDDLVVFMERERVLRGRVVDSQGNPIAGVQLFEGNVPVDFEMDTRRIGRSGSDGAFEIAGTSPGAMVLAGYHHGYAPGWLDVAEGENNVTLRMASGATIRCLLQSSGLAYTGAYVSILYAVQEGGNVTAVRPDEDGVAVLEQVAAGQEFTLSASANYERAALGSRHQYIPLTLRDGEYREFTFRFVIHETRLEVPVTQGGVPQPGLYCSVKYAYPDGMFELVDVHTDDQGIVILEGLPIGACTLLVMPSGVSNRDEAVQVPLVIREGLNTAECAY